MPDLDLDAYGFPKASPLANRTEPLTPRETETELSRLISAIATAQLDLARFRKQRANAYIAYRRARTIAAHRPDCPKVERGITTVDERSAWLDAQTEEEHSMLDKWDVMLDIGIEGLRATLATAEVVRSLNSSVRAAYDRAGYQGENR
jgi:hypothetical protein